MTRISWCDMPRQEEIVPTWSWIPAGNPMTRPWEESGKMPSGIRATVDVLNAQRELRDVNAKLLQARYDYLLNILKLKFYAGTLSEEDVLMINQWLQTRQAR